MKKEISILVLLCCLVGCDRDPKVTSVVVPILLAPQRELLGDYQVRLTAWSEEISEIIKTVPLSVELGKNATQQISIPDLPIGQTIKVKVEVLEGTQVVSEKTEEITLQDQLINAISFEMDKFGPVLSVSAEVLDFSNDKNSIELIIENEGTSTLNWSVGAPNENWIELEKLEGTATKDTPDTIGIGVKRAGLKPKEHKLDLVFSSNGGGKKVTINVNFKRIIEWDKDGSEMVLIPTGSFEMGDSKNEPEDWMKQSRPVHTVVLEAFYMDVHQITVGQFEQFVEESGYDYSLWNDVAEYSPTEEHPIVYVNWDDAVAYAEWAGKRLPTEAEWEYSARGGLKRARYVWGNLAPNGSRCNYADENADAVLKKLGIDWADMNVNDGHSVTAPVGSYPSNDYGLYDMAGNVWEWCADWYGENYYGNSPVKRPQGPGGGKTRVLRGGSWSGDASSLRVAVRNDRNPSGTYAVVGFRCVSEFSPATQQ